MGGREIPDGLYSPGNQLIRNLLGGGGGDGDNPHQNLMQLAVMGQLGDMVYRLTVLGLFHSGTDIKGGLNVQTIGIKSGIGHQRQAQLSGADQYGIGGIVVTQKLLNIVNQGLSLVAHLGTAAVGYDCQILANLNLSHIQGVCKSGSGNVCRSGIRHALQISQIPGQPL